MEPGTRVRISAGLSGKRVSEMKKVFFGCSMRGGYANLDKEELIKIRDLIELLGHELISKHQLENKILDKENEISPKEIHDRDYNWLKEADLGIFEISNPSLGVGSEISDILNLGKPVLCLFKKELDSLVSAYIRGKQGSKLVKASFEYHAYDGLEEAKIFIKEFLERYS